MSSNKSNYLDNKILNFIFNGGTFTAPSTVYIALFTTKPAADGTGGTEVSGNGYARLAVTANTTNFPTTSTESLQNGPALIFAASTGSWGTITSFAFMDASSGGNFLYIGDLASNVTVSSSGIQPTFGSNAITVTEA